MSKAASPSKPSLIAVAPASPRPDPIIIHFNEAAPAPARRGRIQNPALLAIIAILVAAMGGMGFWIWQLKNQPLQVTATLSGSLAPAPPPSAKEAAPAGEYALLALEPLPTKLITGRDFYADKPVWVDEPAADDKLPPVDILPILQQLPVGQLRPQDRDLRKNNSRAFQIDVDDLTPQRNLARAAEQAALAGRLDAAIDLYGKVLRKNPEATSARHNMAALLIERAARQDEQGQAAKALQSYNKALAYIPADSAMAASIAKRIAYLKNE